MSILKQVGSVFMGKLLLKNCLLFDMNNYNTMKKDILIKEDKIIRIDDNIAYQSEDLRILEVAEKYVLPGFIDCHTHMGIIEEATGKLGLDNNETSNSVTPHLRGIDAINPMGCYGTDGKCPVTRMGIAALIRELFMKAQDYMYLKENGKIQKRDIQLESVIPLLKGDIILRAHAHRADDIVTAIRIAEEFNIKKLVIEHGTEAHEVKEFLREKNVPVAFGPMLTPRIKMELRKRNYSSALHLIEAGVKVALITDHPYNSIDQLRAIAALAVSEGLSPLDALKSITINPAQILECDNRIGSLKEGNDADIIILNGKPFDIVNTKVVITILNGEIVFDRSRLKHQ